MWIVRLALRRPYAFVVVALLILSLDIVTIERMPVDMFPAVKIPVVTVIWSFTGMSADDMEKRVLTVTERAMTTTVANVAEAQAQVTALVQTPWSDPMAVFDFTPSRSVATSARPSR